MERHYGAQDRRRSRRGDASAGRALARLVAGGDLQLQSDRRLCTDLRQPEHQGLAGLRAERLLVEAEFGHLFKKGRHTVEYRFLKNDGNYCWVSDELRVVYDKNRQPAEVVGSWSDITARKTAEDIVAETRAQVERLLASSPAVIYSFKATGDFAPTFVSQNIKDWLGYEPSDYLESPDF